MVYIFEGTKVTNITHKTKLHSNSTLLSQGSHAEATINNLTICSLEKEYPG